jgi:hypothetical protein
MLFSWVFKTCHSSQRFIIPSRAIVKRYPILETVMRTQKLSNAEEHANVYLIHPKDDKRFLSDLFYLLTDQKHLPTNAINPEWLKFAWTG